ncbi:radical SAM protein [Candidatus Pacearchaeota archaeon]|nr:radical SAM protein [Candidatus Pacearchaeota archaeon]
MAYKVMRLRKYYDAIRSNQTFFKTSSKNRSKILFNIIKFLNNRGKIIINNKPVVAQIEPTSECNLDCEMCIREKIGVPIGSLSFEDFKKILDKLDCLFKIHLSGQGEPFLNKEIFQMIEYANNRGILINLSSNGTLLTNNIIDKICDTNIGEIAVSLDSVNKKNYEKIRKGAKFEKVLENIRKLNLELKKRNKETILSLSIVIMKKNIKELPEFISLANNLGVKKLIFQGLQEKQDYVEKYNPNAKQESVSELNHEIKEAVRNAKILAKNHGITIIFDEEKTFGCIWPWRSIYITWNGYVTPCCKILNYRKPCFGNILKEDFWKIWNGENYQSYRKLLRERKAPLACNGCNRV